MPIWALVQAARPSAWEGLTTSPAGRVTAASFSAALEMWPSSVFWGWCRSTSRPEGESVEVGGRRDGDRRFELRGVAAVDRDRVAFQVGGFIGGFFEEARLLPAVGLCGGEGGMPGHSPGTVIRPVAVASAGGTGQMSGSPPSPRARLD